MRADMSNEANSGKAILSLKSDEFRSSRNSPENLSLESLTMGEPLSCSHKGDKCEQVKQRFMKRAESLWESRNQHCR